MLNKDENEGLGKQFTPPDHWKLLDVGDMKNWECPETSWIVEDIIASGTFNLVAGASQTGKSLLWLYICAKLLKAGKLFDTYKIEPVDKVLYLALEDPVQRIKDRLKEVVGTDSINLDRFMIYSVPDLNLTKEDQFDWLENYVAKSGANLVVLDTYQKATTGLDSYKDEEQSKILHRLANLTRKHNVTMVVLDHIRKSKNSWSNKRIGLDDVKGTGGKIQNSDAVIIMERRGKRLTISTTSKDTDKQQSFILDVHERGTAGEKFTLVEIGNQTEKESGQDDSKNMQIIQAEFREKGIASVTQVARSTTLSDSTVRRCVKSLKGMNVLKQHGQGRNTKYEYINQTGMIN